jgi:hypothetical protein
MTDTFAAPEVEPIAIPTEDIACFLCKLGPIGIATACLIGWGVLAVWAL